MMLLGPASKNLYQRSLLSGTSLRRVTTLLICLVWETLLVPMLLQLSSQCYWDSQALHHRKGIQMEGREVMQVQKGRNAMLMSQTIVDLGNFLSLSGTQRSCKYYSCILGMKIFKILSTTHPCLSTIPQKTN